MRFTVIWYSSAQNDLARIWLAAIERNSVTNAADRIDSLLRENAHVQGADFYGWKLLRISPLAVMFRVDSDNRQVQVRQVWRVSSSN